MKSTLFLIQKRTGNEPIQYLQLIKDFKGNFVNWTFSTKANASSFDSRVLATGWILKLNGTYKGSQFTLVQI